MTYRGEVTELLVFNAWDGPAIEAKGKASPRGPGHAIERSSGYDTRACDYGSLRGDHFRSLRAETS